MESLTLQALSLGIIEKINSSNRNILAKALKDRGLQPKRSLVSIRKQANDFNISFALQTSSTPVLTRSNTHLHSSHELPPTVSPDISFSDQPILVPESIVPSSAPAVQTVPNKAGTSLPRSKKPFNINFSTWPVNHFSGVENIREFFARLEEIARSREFHTEFLPSILAEFLKARALTYYRVIYKDTISWQEIKKLFQKRFESESYSTERKIEIWSSRQSPNESAADYICRIIEKNLSTDEHLSDTELVQVFKKGLHRKFLPIIVSSKPSSVSQLEELCLAFEQASALHDAALPQASSPNHKPKRAVASLENVKRTDLSHIKCFSCKIMGHYANQCPNKSLVSRTFRRTSPRTQNNTMREINAKNNMKMPDLSKPPPAYNRYKTKNV